MKSLLGRRSAKMRNVAGGKTAIKKIKTASVKCLNKNAHSKCYSKPISFAIANLPVIFCHKPPCDFLSHKSLSLRNHQKAGIVTAPSVSLRSTVSPRGKRKKAKKQGKQEKTGIFKKKRDFREFFDFWQFIKISTKKPKTKEKAKTFAQGKK